MYISRGMPPSPGIGEAAHGPGTSLHLTPRRGKGNMARREGFDALAARAKSNPQTQRRNWHAGRDSRASDARDESPAELGHNPRPSGSKYHGRARSNTGLRSRLCRERHRAARRCIGDSPAALYGPSIRASIRGGTPPPGWERVPFAGFTADSKGLARRAGLEAALSSRLNPVLSDVGTSHQILPILDASNAPGRGSCWPASGVRPPRRRRDDSFHLDLQEHGRAPRPGRVRSRSRSPPI